MTEQIETIGLLEQAVREAVRHNGPDPDVAGVLLDKLQDAGLKYLTARRRVNAVLRAAHPAARRALAEAQVHADTRKAAQLRTAIRRAAGCGTRIPPIGVEDGAGAPARHGEPAYSTFKGGGVCTHPGAAIRKGYKVVYHPSTEEVRVGADWVLNRAGA